jgi:hypothetical protein
MQLAGRTTYQGSYFELKKKGPQYTLVVHSDDTQSVCAGESGASSTVQSTRRRDELSSGSGSRQQ